MNCAHPLRLILLDECSRRSETSLCVFSLLLLFSLLFSLTFSSESLKLFFRWMEGRRTRPTFSMLRFLGMSRLRFSPEKMLLRLAKTSPEDFYFDSFRGYTVEPSFFIFGGRGTKLTQRCSDSGMTMVLMRGSRGTSRS